MKLHLYFSGPLKDTRAMLHDMVTDESSDYVEVSMTISSFPHLATGKVVVEITGPDQDVVDESLRWAVSATKAGFELSTKDADGANRAELGATTMRNAIMNCDVGMYLSLSHRPYTLLYRAGIQSVGELCAKSHDDLLNIRHLGTKSIKEIEDALKAKDLSLRPTTPLAIIQPL